MWASTRTRETKYTKDIVTKYVTIWTLLYPWFHPCSITAIYSKQCIYLQADRLGTNLCISDITFCKSTLHIWCCSFCLAVSFTNLSCSVCAITARIQSLTLFSPGDLAVQLWAFQRNLCMWSIFRPPASLLTTNASAMSSQVQQWGEKRREEFPSTMRMSREKGKADFLLFTRRSQAVGFGRDHFYLSRQHCTADHQRLTSSRQKLSPLKRKSKDNFLWQISCWYLSIHDQMEF